MVNAFFLSPNKIDFMVNSRLKYWQKGMKQEEGLTKKNPHGSKPLTYARKNINGSNAKEDLITNFVRESVFLGGKQLDTFLKRARPITTISPEQPSSSIFDDS